MSTFARTLSPRRTLSPGRSTSRALSSGRSTSPSRTLHDFSPGRSAASSVHAAHTSRSRYVSPLRTRSSAPARDYAVPTARRSSSPSRTSSSLGMSARELSPSRTRAPRLVSTSTPPDSFRERLSRTGSSALPPRDASRAVPHRSFSHSRTSSSVAASTAELSPSRTREMSPGRTRSLQGVSSRYTATPRERAPSPGRSYQSPSTAARTQSTRDLLGLDSTISAEIDTAKSIRSFGVTQKDYELRQRLKRRANERHQATWDIINYSTSTRAPQDVAMMATGSARPLPESTTQEKKIDTWSRLQELEEEGTRRRQEEASDDDVDGDGSDRVGQVRTALCSRARGLCRSCTML